MSLPRLVVRYVERLRRATVAGDRLRAAGGDTIARALSLLGAEDIGAARQALAPLPDASPVRDFAHFLTALIGEAGGDRNGALAALAAILNDETASYDALCLAGDLYGDLNRPEEAGRAYDRAIGLAPHASHAFLRRGRLRSAAGNVTAAIADLETASLLQPGFAEAHLALGDEYRQASMTDAAIAAYRRALAIEPDNQDAAVALDAALAAAIPAWHAAMLNDTRRNDAFDAAIRRAVRPGSHVLDIGTGTGLLAMMAARAGAAHVTACEGVGALAEVAREIIARNRLADRITVVNKRSTELVPGEDLPRPADLLVTEIFDAGLLAEDALATITDARARLLAPDAGVIPAAATVFGMPIDCPAIAAERRVAQAAGFDIEPFNALVPQHYIETDLARYDWRPLTAPVELFHFDFAGDDGAEGDRPGTDQPVTPLADGTAHAVALWFSLGLDAETALATGPMDPPTHWRQAVAALHPPVVLKQNEPARLTVRHTGRRIAVDLKA